MGVLTNVRDPLGSSLGGTYGGAQGVVNPVGVEHEGWVGDVMFPGRL